MGENMTEYRPMQELPEIAGYKAGDVLVLAGELFGRGYANGLVDEAKRLGMTVIGTTVGRRDADGSLRPLNSDELAEVRPSSVERSLTCRWRLDLIWRRSTDMRL